MIDLLKKSAACAFAIISAVFTFVPEAIFGKVILISEDVLKQFTIEGYTSEINIIVNPQDDYYLPFFTQKWDRNMVEKLFPPRSVYHELKATCDAISHIIKIKLLESLHKNRKLQTLEEHLQPNNTPPQRNLRSTHENNKIQ